MYFCHSGEIWRDYPELVPSVLLVRGITESPCVLDRVTNFNALAESRLATRSESELPEVQAWRRIFTRMGLKATQYRSASESLLRRFRREKCLPQIHPLIDLCNSVSLAYAIPVAIFDVTKIAEFIEVRYATGSEVYLAFSGHTENPEPHEVIFADAIGRAHARRWSNRQSGYSAVRDETSNVLIVAEAVHGSAYDDVQMLSAAISNELENIWSVVPQVKILSQSSPRFDF